MAQPELKAITLTIRGEPGSRVSGSCTLETTGGEEAVPVEGPVPVERQLSGLALRCDLTAQGQVVVEIARDGSRTRSATRNGRIRLRVG